MSTTKSLGDTTARISRSELRDERIRVLTRREPVIVATGTPLGDALEQMQLSDGGTVLVCDGERLRGIVTERDVLLKVLARDVDRRGPVDAVMTADPHTLTVDSTVGEAIRMMDQGRFRNIPLVDDEGRVAGLVRQQDLLEYVAEAFPQEILNLPPRPHQLIEEPEGA